MAVQVTPSTPLIGAEIGNVDLSSLGDSDFGEVKKAFLEHQVLFFKDQDLTVEQHMEFGRRFGELHIHPAANGLPRRTQSTAGDFCAFMRMKNTIRTAGDKWHTDVFLRPANRQWPAS